MQRSNDRASALPRASSKPSLVPPPLKRSSQTNTPPTPKRSSQITTSPLSAGLSMSPKRASYSPRMSPGQYSHSPLSSASKRLSARLNLAVSDLASIAYKVNSGQLFSKMRVRRKKSGSFASNIKVPFTFGKRGGLFQSRGGFFFFYFNKEKMWLADNNHQKQIGHVKQEYYSKK